jgi:hypothetical protein
MTEDAYRSLRVSHQRRGLDEGEALSFLFENFDSVTDKDNLTHRLRLFNASSRPGSGEGSQAGMTGPCVFGAR